MPGLPPSGKHLPASLVATHLAVIVDLLGRNGADAVLRSAGLEQWIGTPSAGATVDFAEFAALHLALADTLGWRGARGLSLRMGAQDFEALVKPVGAVAAMAEPAFQSFPLERRLRAGLHGVARSLGQLAPLEVAVVEDPALTFQIGACPECWGRTARTAVCPSMVGLVRAALRWIAPEFEGTVEETDCRAAGARACRFAIRSDSSS
jgi:hypothetical protein